MHRAWAWEVLLSLDWETDEKGNLLFLSERQENRVPEVSGRERRRNAYRRLGVPEHQIDAAIAEADAKMRDLYRQAGAKRKGV